MVAAGPSIRSGGAMGAQPHAFFVYGTLKQGLSNYHLIADSVRAAMPATIRGRLYDVGPFPALAAGDEPVRGEVLTVEPDALPRLLAVLDRLEGYESGDLDGSIYIRRVVAATTDDGRAVEAHAYFYNRDPGGLRHLPAGEWSGPSALEVAEGADELADFGRHVREFGR